MKQAKIDDGTLGGTWDANFDVPRKTKHRANHASWHGKWFSSKNSDRRALVKHPHGYIGDAYGEPTHPNADDNIVLPGHAPNCQCSLKLVYDIKDVPTKYLTTLGRKAHKGKKMPTPYDLLTSKIEPPNPEDELRNAIGQQQGKTLGGLGTPDMAAKPHITLKPPMPTVLGPLAALAKPHIRLKTPMPGKPRIRLKVGGIP